MEQKDWGCPWSKQRRATIIEELLYLCNRCLPMLLVHQQDQSYPGTNLRVLISSVVVPVAFDLSLQHYHCLLLLHIKIDVIQLFSREVENIVCLYQAVLTSCGIFRAV